MKSPCPNSPKMIPKAGQLFEKTNAEGIADFGLLPYGSYNLSISCQAGSTHDSLTLRPEGRSTSELWFPEKHRRSASSSSSQLRTGMHGSGRLPT